MVCACGEGLRISSGNIGKKQPPKGVPPNNKILTPNVSLLLQAPPPQFLASIQIALRHEYSLFIRFHGGLMKRATLQKLEGPWCTASSINETL